jgi:hypothetical protein
MIKCNNIFYGAYVIFSNTYNITQHK